MGSEEIVREALKIAADICVFTNENIVVEKLDAPDAKLDKEEKNARGN
jgi:ATP-dependent HslUV protease subunit HslV